MCAKQKPQFSDQLFLLQKEKLSISFSFLFAVVNELCYFIFCLFPEVVFSP